MSASSAIDTGPGFGRQQVVERAEHCAFVVGQRGVVVQKPAHQGVARFDKAQPAQVTCSQIRVDVVGQFAHSASLYRGGDTWNRH